MAKQTKSASAGIDFTLPYTAADGSFRISIAERGNTSMLSYARNNGHTYRTSGDAESLLTIASRLAELPMLKSQEEFKEAVKG